MGYLITQSEGASGAGVKIETASVIELNPGSTSEVSVTGNMSVSGTINNINIATHNHTSGAGASIGTNAITNSAVTYEKIQNVYAADKILGRTTTGTGVIEEITCTSSGRALIAASTVADQRTILELGNVTNNAQVKKIASSADNAIVRWDGTTGDAVQSSVVTIDDAGNISGAVSVSGNAATATKATNLSGGSAGSIPYQTELNSTTMLPVGSPSTFLKVDNSGIPSWSSLVASDIPSLSASKITSGTLSISCGGTNQTSFGTNQGSIIVFREGQLQSSSITDNNVTTHFTTAADSTTLGHVKIGNGLTASSGTVSADFGQIAGKVCQGDDSRLSDSRTPKSHASTHCGSGATDIISNATSSYSGLMSSSDKIKLDNATDANHPYYIVMRDASGGFTGNLYGNANTATTSYSCSGNANTATSAGYVTNPSQTNITSVGTLGSLSVSGGVSAGSFSTAGTVSANTLSGTLSTPSQTNITAVGTLSSLTVSGNINAATFTGTASYATAAGTLSSTLVIGKGGTNNTSFSDSYFLMYSGGAIISSSSNAGSFSLATHNHSGATLPISITGNAVSLSGTLIVSKGGTGTTGITGIVKGNGGESPFTAATAADLPAHTHASSAQGGTLYNANGTGYVSQTAGASTTFKITVTNGIVTYFGAP